MQDKSPIIFDTSVLVAFSCVREISLLKSIFSSAMISSAVFDELVTQGRGWTEAKEAQLEAISGNWLRTVDLGANGIAILGNPNLDDGERGDFVSIRVEIGSGH